MTYKLVVFVFCLVVQTLAYINYDSVERDIQFQCIKHCPLQNRTDLGHYDYACNYHCNIEQCSKGCNLWKDALSTSCQKVCNGTSDRLSHRELYCVMGCNDAITKYFAQIRILLGIPPAPALLDNSLEATSLRLEWRFPEAANARLSCHVQWRYEEIAATWQYCRNATWNPSTSDFYVEGLQPYTKYRFRIALNLGHGHGDPIFSDQSVVIATLAAGVPASPPTHVRAAPVDAHSVSVNWEPGPFPHGPLLSYVLQITDNNPTEGHETRSEVKDVPSTSTFYLYHNLQPDKNYTVSIQMRNSYGPGPAATTQVSTPKEPLIPDNQQPILILGTQYGIFEMESLFGDTLHLYHSDETVIQGIGIHISKQLLFISDANGSVWRIPIEQETKNQTRILSPEQLDFFPLDVSVDWLNDQLYILGEAKPRKSPARYLIKRCNLDGTGLTVALAGLTKKPIAMEIDPCNGYLFWAVRDFSTGGVYRLDVSDISNGIKHEVKVSKILDQSNVGAFVVDYTNFRLFVSNQKDNTILAVSLDGKDVKNIRQNVVNAKLQNVHSLGTVNQRFYWTDGITVYNEEYHQRLNTYFHNRISHLGKSQYKKILINLNSSQPWPIPFNPPTNFQAVFGNSIAKTKWLPPHLLGLQGKGAWQNWSYEISVINLQTNDTTTHKTNATSLSIGNLTENNKYLLRVSAYSKSGKGPWSSEFRGLTLEVDKTPAILWSGTEGLFKSDAAIETVETLIHKSRLNDTGFTGMSWYHDQIYMVTNSSHVYWYNLTSYKQGRLADIDSVGSIAVDWIGKKLYWSNLKQQLIIRSNLNGTQQEPLSILTFAKEISIDSVKAYLYWSREYVVECAHLNGQGKMEYDHLEPFSGKQVMGLTLDINEKQVYWIVRGSDSSHLYRAPMAGYSYPENIKKTKVALLQKPNMQGPLSYFSKRLLWLQDERNAVVSDLEGKNLATVNGKSIWGLNLVYVVDDSLHFWPDGIKSKEGINVIPEMVDENYVKTVGSSDTFNITWNPIKNVNYGVVFYEVQLEGLPRNNATIITTEPTVRYWREVTPFTRLYVTIRAFTYWATSPQIRAELFSPPSTPSAPRNLRTYVVYEHNNLLDGENHVSVTFRWDPPLYPNGVLQGYRVRCWYILNDNQVDICINVKKSAFETEYVISELSDNEIYYFQVQAFTEIGTGTTSTPISVNSSHEAPLPTLLIASTDSIFINDIDANHNQLLLNGINTPLEITYLMREHKIFWVNEMQELLMYHFQSSNKTKLYDLKRKPKGLALDWLERSLYYVAEATDDVGSALYKINLNHHDKSVVKSMEIFSTSANITKIEISPYTRKIYWVENVGDETHKVMSSSFDGSNIQEFFTVRNRKKRDILHDYFSETRNDCNCPDGINVEPTFTIDHSETENRPRLIFVDSENKNIFTSDKDGCICDVIANNTIVSNTFPIKTIKSDFDSLYWTNPDGVLHAMKRKNADLLTKTIKAQDVMIYGKHMQPYPPKECLSPNQHSNFKPTIKRKSFNFLTLKMPRVIYEADCMNSSVPTVMYTIRYKELLHPEMKPRVLMTFDEVFNVQELKPFTMYSVSVAVSSHFTDDSEIVFGEPIVVRTSPGAPSKPQNISASVLHPTLAQVNWLPPEELNGEVIHYEIHWLTEGSLTGVRQKGEQSVNDLRTLDSSTNVLTTLLQKLTPNETYSVWIRAYSETNESSSDSDIVQITTYPEPAAFVLINKTSQSLFLSWEVTPHIQRYVVEYAPITSTHTWIQAILGETSDEMVNILVRKLKPKTQYKFRLSLLYDKYPEWYIWPIDSRFTFETLGDRPSPPGTPGIQFFGSNMYKVVWEVPQDNGAPIELYSLETLRLRSYRNKRSTNTNRTAWFYTAPAIEEEESFDWEQVYNGTENSWIITDLDQKYKYSFRAAALNSYGWSNYSAESNEFDYNEAEIMSQKNPMNLIFIATFVPISICITIIMCFSYMTYSRRCGKQKKIEQVVAIPRGPDVELATLRELPRRGVHSTNILYVSAAPNGEDITMLPHIRRDQITLTKFLGSGAFGEVFEGKAKGLSNQALETKVAVKTLKKGASDQEKSEFLQEAQLMSHFKHEHILQLLGVCLDNDPQFIIMELMEGGDLLTYLRDSRSGLNDKPSLTLIELLKMCLDVTKGCRYLEEMHFVHRDLACRNCLVSSVESENRIVKIGDFGLARDIYKNDYYRKEGEGLLPVRWMAPESLLDGVFTCQSDVWAFGVLLWEIMTLGQQPYQARSNLEVLHYVKAGGRLGKPMDCPENLYKLMLKCWEYEAEQRPTFKYCLEVLDCAHREHLRDSTTAAHSQYISTVPDLFAGISNAAYFLDENENSSGMSWKSENDEEGSKEQTPFLSPEQNSEPKEIPKYLELLYEPEQEPTPLENDGYEIPNHMLQPKELNMSTPTDCEVAVNNQENAGSTNETKDENNGIAVSNNDNK